VILTLLVQYFEPADDEILCSFIVVIEISFAPYSFFSNEESTMRDF
jgi:hypothetical protein